MRIFTFKTSFNHNCQLWINILGLRGFLINASKGQTIIFRKKLPSHYCPFVLILENVTSFNHNGHVQYSVSKSEVRISSTVSKTLEYLKLPFPYLFYSHICVINTARDSSSFKESKTFCLDY